MLGNTRRSVSHMGRVIPTTGSERTGTSRYLPVIITFRDTKRMRMTEGNDRPTTNRVKNEVDPSI